MTERPTSFRVKFGYKRSQNTILGKTLKCRLKRKVMYKLKFKRTVLA